MFSPVHPRCPFFAFSPPSDATETVFFFSPVELPLLPGDYRLHPRFFVSETPSFFHWPDTGRVFFGQYNHLLCSAHPFRFFPFFLKAVGSSAQRSEIVVTSSWMSDPPRFPLLVINLQLRSHLRFRTDTVPSQPVQVSQCDSYLVSRFFFFKFKPACWLRRSFSIRDSRDPGLFSFRAPPPHARPGDGQTPPPPDWKGQLVHAPGRQVTSFQWHGKGTRAHVISPRACSPGGRSFLAAFSGALFHRTERPSSQSRPPHEDRQEAILQPRWVCHARRPLLDRHYVRDGRDRLPSFFFIRASLLLAMSIKMISLPPG